MTPTDPPSFSAPPGPPPPPDRSGPPAAAPLEAPPSGPAPAPRPLPRSLRIYHGVAAFFLMLGMILVAGVAVVLALPDPAAQVVPSLLATGLAMGAAVVLVLAWARPPLGQVFPRGRRPVSAVLGGLLAGAGVALWNLSTVARLYDPESLHLQMLEEMVTSLQETVGVPGLLAIVALAVPLWEELLFRGVILRSFAGPGRGRITGRAWLAVGVSAVLFALIHMHPVHMLVAFLLGIVAGALLVLTRSFWAALAVHVSNNGLAIVLGLGLADPEATLPPLWALPGLALLIAGIGLAVAGARGAATDPYGGPAIAPVADPADPVAGPVSDQAAPPRAS